MSDELGRELTEALDSLRDVPPPDEGRRAAHHAAFLTGAREQHRVAQPAVRPGRQRRGVFRPAPALARRWAMVAVAAATVLALLASSGGVLYAADAAVPGDPLYGIDQAVESARLGLTHRPESVLELLLSLAEERLLEAEELAAQQDEGNLGAVLESYGATVSSLAQTLGAVEGEDQTTLTALLDNAFSNHEGRLTKILGPVVASAELEDPVEDGADYCVGSDPHPAAQKLAAAYGVTYEAIMGWFCDGGYGLGEIEHALQTGAATGMTPDELLALRTELGGWGEVWQQLGLIGANDGDDPDDLSEEDLAYCVGAGPHPVAQRLAEAYGVPYEQIMGWFCQGRYGLGEIMHALQTGGDEDGNTPEELLHRKTELGGWGQVWQEMGLIGRPDEDEDMVKDKPAKQDKKDKKNNPKK